MAGNILIFIPNTLEKHKIGYLRGFRRQFKDTEAYYIISDKVGKNSFQCIGYVGKNPKIEKISDFELHIDTSSGKIGFISEESSKANSLTEVVYDYDGFMNSDVVYHKSEYYGKHFKLLTRELRKLGCSNASENGRTSLFINILLYILILINLLIKVLDKLKTILFYSETFLYFEESIQNLKWFLITILNERKLTPKLGNALTAKLIDLFIGIVLLNWFLKYENDVIKIIHNTIEMLITNLKGLLLYLMGSPIGLKLNHAFNRSLGQFFFYHISLWTIFIQGIEPMFINYYKFLVIPGILGFSLQISMLSDIISIVSFHIYCIYVYAARLFSLQLKGLISLWRLFIGRKYNPLRNRVDSYQYSPNQLFIGTLSFTVLLFLLPTSTMYYTVFSVFRLIILGVSGLLWRLRYLLNAIPTYIVFLWFINSPSLRGTLYIEWKGCCNDNATVKIEANLKPSPLWFSVKKFIPDSLQAGTGNKSSYLFHCMITGTLM